MTLVTSITRQFDYNVWANREALRAMLAAKDVPARAVEVMAHVVGAEWLWLRRLGHASPEFPVWPVLSLDDCHSQLEALAKAWRDFLVGVNESSLGREIIYTNTK